MLTQKAAKASAASGSNQAAADAENSMGNEGSHLSGNSASATSSEMTSSAQWKKDETMLLQYIILNVAD